jgi:hypothetical protein
MGGRFLVYPLGTAWARDGCRKGRRRERTLTFLVLLALSSRTVRGRHFGTAETGLAAPGKSPPALRRDSC